MTVKTIGALVPPVVENITCPNATLWLVPKLRPSMTTVAPIVPEGRVAPFTTVTAGGPEGPVGPLLPPHAASRAAADRRMTIRTRIGDSYRRWKPARDQCREASD